MSQSDSNSRALSGKSENALPAKPQRPEGDSTLFWHASGRWAKKIRGRFCYFGRGTYQEAIDLYQVQKNDLHSGRRPRDGEPEGLTVYLLCAKFLTTKTIKVKAGKLAKRTLDDYAATCKLIIKAFGKNRLVCDLGPDDFERLHTRMSKTWGVVRMGNEINRVRIVFRYGFEQGHTKERIVFGEAFTRPSRKTLRQHRDAQGVKMFEAHEIRSMLADASQPLRTMILLAINSGYGNNDIAAVPLTAIDFDGAWATFPRPKTGTRRRCPLWAETVQSLREWMKDRPEPKDPDHTGFVFITKYGQPWGIENRSLSNEIRKLLDSLSIKGKRNFYSLRHTFQTVADESGDFVTVRRLMGHVRDDDIGDVYRERVSDERLKKVTEHVRNWLFAGSATGS